MDKDFEEILKTLKSFEKSDQELVHDIIDMELLDASEPIYVKKEVNDNDESNVI